jgi:hypothetical protein
MRYFKGAVDFIVVRDGDKGHPPPTGDMVEMQRLGKALRAADFLEKPLGWPGGVARV